MDDQAAHPRKSPAGPSGNGSIPNLAIPNLRHLQVVEMIARYGSISQAASEANLSQPAVTQAIARLEQSIGYPLFERGNHGTRLTQAGSIYLARLHRFFKICEATIEEACRHLSRKNRPYHITSAQLRCLQALTQEATTERAAARIGVSGSTLKRALRELEAVLGVSLREQTRYGIVLNATGRELAQQVSLAINELTAAREDLTVLEGREGGRISIGTLPLSGAYVIGEAIAELTQRYPEARISVTNAPYNMLLSALKSSEIDMIFGLLHDHDQDSGVVGEPMFSDHYCILANASHPLARQARVGIDDLLRYEWIAPASGSPRRRRFDQIFAAEPRQPRIYIEMSNLSAILAILARTNFLTLVSRLEIQRELDLGIVDAIPVPVVLPPAPKGLTYRANWKPTPIQARFLEILRNQVCRSERAQRDQSAHHLPVADRGRGLVV